MHYVTQVANEFNAFIKQTTSDNSGNRLRRHHFSFFSLLSNALSHLAIYFISFY